MEVLHYYFSKKVEDNLTSSNDALPALSPIPLIVTSNCLAPARAP
jgi:hypothetical protein